MELVQDNWYHVCDGEAANSDRHNLIVIIETRLYAHPCSISMWKSDTRTIRLIAHPSTHCSSPAARLLCQHSQLHRLVRGHSLTHSLVFRRTCNSTWPNRLAKFFQPGRVLSGADATRTCNDITLRQNARTVSPVPLRLAHSVLALGIPSRHIYTSFLGHFDCHSTCVTQL